MRNPKKIGTIGGIPDFIALQSLESTDKRILRQIKNLVLLTSQMLIEVIPDSRIILLIQPLKLPWIALRGFNQYSVIETRREASADRHHPGRLDPVSKEAGLISTWESLLRKPALEPRDGLFCR